MKQVATGLNANAAESGMIKVVAPIVELEVPEFTKKIYRENYRDFEYKGKHCGKRRKNQGNNCSS